MGTALDVHTDVYSLDENQDVISIKGQMPSFFSFGDYQHVLMHLNLMSLINSLGT